MTTTVTIKIEHAPHGSVRVLRLHHGRGPAIETQVITLADGETTQQYVWQRADLVIREEGALQ